MNGDAPEPRDELRPPSLPHLDFPELIGIVVQVFVIALFIVAMGGQC